MPTIEIAGLCLPLKPQKERGLYRFINMKVYPVTQETGFEITYRQEPINILS